MPAAFTFTWRLLSIVIASFASKRIQDGTLRNSPGGQHVECPVVRVDLPALHNCKITTKVNIWGQVYFGETSSSLVSKIRNSAGCMWFEASCQRTLSQGSTVLLFVAAWECASKPSLSCPFICADPLPMVGRLYLTNFGRLPPPALTSMTPA